MDIWEKTKVGQKFKTVLPKILRENIGIRKGFHILWVSFEKKPKFKSQYEAYTIDIVIIPKD